MQPGLIMKINDLMSHYKPSDLRKLKSLLNDADNDANDQIHWHLLDSKISHKMQSAFMKHTCSPEKFQEWIETTSESDYIKERHEKAYETAHDREFWKNRMRHKWADFQPMRRRVTE